MTRSEKISVIERRIWSDKAQFYSVSEYEKDCDWARTSQQGPRRILNIVEVHPVDSVVAPHVCGFLHRHVGALDRVKLGGNVDPVKAILLAAL